MPRFASTTPGTSAQLTALGSHRQACETDIPEDSVIDAQVSCTLNGPDVLSRASSPFRASSALRQGSERSRRMATANWTAFPGSKYSMT